MPKLILARHGATPYNEAGIWTGLTDIDMSEKGYGEVAQSAKILANYSIDIALSSSLIRARNTAKVILASQINQTTPLIETSALNEKDYGVFTGKSKENVKTEYGNDTYMQIRRSWDYPIEDGESLEQVHSRVVPIHHKLILPILSYGHTVLVASHNNTLRAYIKEIESLSVDQTSNLELGTAEVRIYDFRGQSLQLEAQHTIGSVH